MSGILQRVPWSAQPQYAAVPVDKSNPFAKRTIWFSTPNTGNLLRDIIAGADITNPGGKSVSEPGQIATFNGSQAGNRVFALPSGVALDHIVIAARIRAPSAQAANPGAAFGLYASSGSQTGIGVGFDNAGNVGAAYLDNNGAGLAAKSASTNGVWYTVFVQANTTASTIKAWIDGKPATTQSVAWVPVSTVNEIAIGAQHRAAGFLRNFTGDIAWAALLYYPGTAGAFSFDDAAAVQLYRSGYPWQQLFTPPPRRVWETAAGGAVSLTIADGAHAHAADSLALTLDTYLAVQDAAHAHAADSLGLTLDTYLAVADAFHDHLADNLTLVAFTGTTLDIAEAAHAHTADSLTLTLDTWLAIAEALHAHGADSLAFTLDTYLAVADSTHAHAADNLTLTLPGAALTDGEFRQLYDWVNELALIHGLISGSDLVVTPTSRDAGAVNQTIATVGTTVTVSR